MPLAKMGESSIGRGRVQDKNISTSNNYQSACRSRVQNVRGPSGIIFNPFDIHLQQRRHHGFGGGAHHCLGYFVARTDMASAVRAIANTFKSFSIGDTPVYLPDSGNTSSQILPLSYEI